jgi:hypothetical protein
MPTAEFLRQKAQEVRALIALARTPEVITQLKMWAQELDDEAAKVEELAAHPSVPQSSRRPAQRRGKRIRRAAPSA